MQVKHCFLMFHDFPKLHFVSQDVATCSDCPHPTQLPNNMASKSLQGYRAYQAAFAVNPLGKLMF